MSGHEGEARGGMSPWAYVLAGLLLIAVGLVFRPVFESWLGIGVLDDPRNISANQSVFGLDLPIEAGFVVDGTFRGGDELVSVIEGSVVRPAFRVVSLQPVDINRISFSLDGVEVPANQVFVVPEARAKPYEMKLEGVGHGGRVHFGASCIFKVDEAGGKKP